MTKIIEKQVELSPIHDFAGKLLQEGLFERLKKYVEIQVAWRKAKEDGKKLDILNMDIESVPISINLDLTTACNYRCDHCVDKDILNTGIRFEDDKLEDSIRLMAKKGLKSVIVIGGGEPTVHPKFASIMRLMKSLNLSLGLVTNGGNLGKVLEIADCLDEKDWIRLSLDSGRNNTFRIMHNPRTAITLEEICKFVPLIKNKNPKFKIGFSFIVVWDNCEANDKSIHENIKEMELAAKLAKQNKFDYISFKPFLTRADVNNAEVVELTKEEQHIKEVMKEIRKNITKAKELEGEGFKVVESTNLKVLENGTYINYTRQPKNCHMQFFRQILSPFGVFNCPVYRNVSQATIGNKNAYSDEKLSANTTFNTLKLIDKFDATKECKDVTCLYNHANWFIEDLIKNPHKLNELEAKEDRKDYYF